MSIQIPLIFDVSANGTVFGEDISGDVIESHIKLKLNATEAQSTAFINAMKKILYSDVADDASSSTEGNGVLFFKDGANPENAIGHAIRNIFMDTSGIQHAGADSQSRYGLAGNNIYGIPYGIRQGQDSSSGIVQNDVYSDGFIDADGTEFYKILLRIAATHLMGHPFSQGFIQENSIKSDLSNVDLSGQVGRHFSLSNLTNIEGDVSRNFTDGVQVNILQTIYEQLLVNNTNDMSGSDVSGIVIQYSDNNRAHARPLVFKAENVVTFFVRPRLFLKLDVSGGIQNMSSAVGDALGISGSSELNSDLSGTQLEIFNQVFSINNSPSNPNGYFWLAGRNHDNLSNWATNLNNDDNIDYGSSGAIAMLDAHVWKIDVKLC